MPTALKRLLRANGEDDGKLAKARKCPAIALDTLIDMAIIRRHTPFLIEPSPF
jgi:hypothetical protein